MRLRWTPTRVDHHHYHQEEVASGPKPAEETVEVDRIITVVQLRDGVISHAVARRLDKMGLCFDADEFEYDSGCYDTVQRGDIDAESLAAELDKFCGWGRSTLECHPAQFATGVELQKWLQLSEVDFAEIFRGFAEAAIRVREAGLSASEGFDNRAITYERTWHLDHAADQADCAFLLLELRPEVVHLGTPRAKMSALGKQIVDAAAEM
jgi:hypothetical protein